MLVLASGVIIGLLAMHTIVSSPGDHGEQVPAMAAEMATPGGAVALATSDTVGMPGTCSGMCDPGHAMASMACVLALLFGGLVLFITNSRQWSTYFAATRSRWRAIGPVACLAMPPPPDLNALSISRT
ncbi:hypothetical protein BH10ACT4_BH10ACT4_01670 [soil metagenome]